MIAISNCPTTGLQRKVVYDFFWFTQARQIIIKCTVTYYKNGEVVTDSRLKPYVRDLVASDSLVDPLTGAVLTDEQIADYHSNVAAWDDYQANLAAYQADLAAYPALLTAYEAAMAVSPQNPDNLPVPTVPVEPVPSPMPTQPGPEPMEEYDFYTTVLGVTEIVLPTLIENVILLRDSQGKFDI